MQVGLTSEPPFARKLADNVIEELWFGDEDPTRSHFSASRSMAAAAAKAAGLKPFPTAAQRAMAALDDPDLSVFEVVRAIEHDPALATRVLGLANSALYRGGREISGVPQAVVRLGNKTVREAVAAMAVLGMFDDASGLALRFREHIVGVGALARTLANAWSHSEVEDVFLGGLLHDVGKLLSLQVGELPYVSWSDEFFAGPERLHIAEREACGYDHAVLGGHVVELWQLPIAVAKTVAWHHQPGRAFAEGGTIGLQVALIRIADRIEYELAGEVEPNPERIEEFLDELGRDGAVDYAGFSRGVMAGMWPKLREARQEAVAFFG